MTQTKHTEGPWAIETPCGFPYAGIYIVSHQANKNKDFHSFIAEVRQYREDHSSPAGCGEGTANARLISQAPTLLAERDRLREINRELRQMSRGLRQTNQELREALKRAIAAADPETDPDYDWIGQAETTIAKADTSRNEVREKEKK